MDWIDYCRRFREEARLQGKSEQFIEENLVYAETLAKAKLPIIYDVAHLSSLVGFEENALRSALEEPSELYKIFPIPKRGVGYRWISKPVPSLMAIQGWILENILNKCRPHEAANAFFRGRSIRKNAEPHLRQRMVLSLDVEEFFPSLRPKYIRSLFQRVGYSPEVARFFTMMTTVDQGLPQGAPTSPALSNLVLFGVDERLDTYARAHSLHYSRYADDLTFSGRRFRPGAVIEEVRQALKVVDLVLNEKKTRLMQRHQRQEVTGVVVNERIQAIREIRRTLRQEVYYIKKYGFGSHESRKCSLYRNRLDHLRGIAEFVLFLNPADSDARAAVEVLGRVRFERSPVGGGEDTGAS